MNYQKIIDKYYPNDNEQKRILLHHSKSVVHKALQICDNHPELKLDRCFIEEAAMLHDIGIFACNAPGIKCYGQEPYLIHGYIGAELLRKEGFPYHARVCERHTGTGISKDLIQKRGLPLPLDRVYIPETMEEKVICYADKFFSKSHLKLTRTIDETYKSLIGFGIDTANRFKEWSLMFE